MILCTLFAGIIPDKANTVISFYFKFYNMKNSYHVSLDEAIKLLNKEEKRFVQVMEDGKMTVEYYAPKKIDGQQPHKKDEVYIIASGNSDFYRNEETIKCKKGDVIFVPAKMEHRFVNFSDDFATWVIFYGEEIF